VRLQRKSIHYSRRAFLSSLGGAAGIALSACTRVGGPGSPAEDVPTGPADVTLRIGPVLADIAKDHTISTTGYNGSTPGPLIRFKEGVPVTIDIFNDLDTPELVHWHGMWVPVRVDGSEEEKSLSVPARGNLRYRLTPQPAGARFVHTHVMPMSDLSRGTYGGQFALVYVEPKNNPGQYDQEVFLATHEWEGFFTGAEDQDEELPLPPPDYKKDDKPNGWEIGYQRFTINGKCLGHGDPVRVKQGQRVLFHILNGSATENIQLALPGHRFQVVGMDGNPVPHPQMVDVLELGAAERIDAVVEMNRPGVWILGTPKDDDRRDGMGIVIEYANQSGAPRWIKPPKQTWDYTIFGETRTAPAPDETIPLVIGKMNGGEGGFNQWTLNGKSYDPKDPPRELKKGRRYRLVFDNHTDDAHPVHLHRNSFELTNVHGKATSGVMKDVVLVKGFRKIEVDVTPTQEGLTLFHCHQQLHMDYGFKLLFNVV
jgi:FtsP/CotA-like multicopper oxidase with cupredoxin domain